MKICKKSFIIALVVFLSFSRVSAQSLSFARNFELEDTRGNKITLNSFKGKQFVFLFFWTTWCPFCVKGLKLLNDRYVSLAKDNVKLLAINVGESRSQLERFLKNSPVACPIFLDKDTSVARSFNLMGVPTYIIINKDGRIVYEENYFPDEEYKNLIGTQINTDEKYR
mgnify:CR=1 FL=1